MTGPRLPMELNHLIIETVALLPQNKPALRALSLVSHSFSAHAQKQLFRVVDLGDRALSGPLYYRKFYRFMKVEGEKDDGRLRGYIKEFKVVDTYAGWDPLLPTTSSTTKGWEWLVREESICDLLDWLSSLESFSICFNTGTPAWSNFVPCIRRALIQRLSRGILQFEMRRVCGFPPALFVNLLGLVGGGSIHTLILDDVLVRVPQIVQEEGDDESTHSSLASSLGVISNFLSTNPSAPPATSPLRTLVLRSSVGKATINVIRNILALYPQPSLRTLRIAMTGIDEQEAFGMTSEPFGSGSGSANGHSSNNVTTSAAAIERGNGRDVVLQMWELMRWAGDSIKVLEWRSATRPKTRANVPPPPIHLSIFPNLESITFLVNFHAASSVNAKDKGGVFSPLIEVLSQIRTRAWCSSYSGNSSLQNITIECMFIQPGELVAAESEWAALDVFLCMPPAADDASFPRGGNMRFSNLSSLTFHARIKASSPMRSRTRAILTQQLPELRVRKGVKVDICWDFG
ncbi:hypothetical protein CPC08DRAFT_710300 [Agrocybe pediades]|nr:hypothetical protein CPC08DRAFT_710300 [Agrocybe pediades]